MANKLERSFLVIVDDEKDLLDNIKESFEDEQYDDILNIRTRTSGESAVDLGKKIKANDGDVALLLTDMVMPGMKGLEVIEEYKKLFPDAIRMILTGYADKESAIKAINEGGVNAYLEKDKPTEAMFPRVNQLLKKYFHQTDRDIAFIFKELETDPQEFEEYFTLRYLTWQQEGWRDPNKQWIDVDGFDYFSKYICAFEKRIDFSRLAAGLRKIYPDNETGNEEIIEEIVKKRKYSVSGDDLKEHESLVREKVLQKFSIEALIEQLDQFEDIIKTSGKSLNDILNAIFADPRFEIDTEKKTLIEHSLRSEKKNCILPSFIYHDTNGALTKFSDLYKSLIEIGRLAIAPKYRAKYHGNRVNYRLHEEMFANCILDDDLVAIICCNPIHHKYFYRGLGFKHIEEVPKILFSDSEPPSTVYYADARSFSRSKPSDSDQVKIPKERVERVKLYAEKLDLLRKDPENYVSCSCSNLDICLKEDYLSPISTPTDYHCPIRVQNFLSYK